MPRKIWNDGQEISYDDLNAISAAVERGMFDRVISELVGRQTNAFFADSFYPAYVNATTLQLTAGNGLALVSAAVSPEPNRQPLYLAAPLQLSLAAPHPSQARIDIVVVKPLLGTELTGTRKYKAANTTTVTSQSFTVQKDWGADALVVTGTPADSPVAPATPAGYLRIASVLVTAVNGLAAQAGITDERTIFNLGGGAAGFDAVVGSGLGSTHSSLAAAISSVPVGGRILVTSDQTLNSTVVLNKNNVLIDFKPGVSILKGTATKGLQVTANRCRVRGGRMAGFSATGDIALEITAAANYTMVRDIFFGACDTEINDLGTGSSIQGTVTE